MSFHVWEPMPGVYHISYTLRSIRLRWRNCILIQRICDDLFEGFRKVLEMREKMRDHASF